MKYILSLLIIIVCINCNHPLPKPSDPSNFSPKTTSEAQPDSLQIRQKFDAVCFTTKMLLKTFTPIDTRDSAFENWTIACTRLLSIKSCEDWKLSPVANSAIPFSLVVATDQLIDSAAKICPPFDVFKSTSLDMVFIAPTSPGITAKILVKWDDFKLHGDLLNALELLHEYRHYLQWQEDLKQIHANRDKENLEREYDAWDFQCRLWIASMTPEQLEMVQSKKALRTNMPMSINTMDMKDAQDFEKYFGAYHGYWDMFLYYTYGNRFVKETYMGLDH